MTGATTLPDPVRAWAEQPRLRTAFFTGYGRRLIPEEKRALFCLTALHTVGGRAEWGTGRQRQEPVGRLAQEPLGEAAV